MTYRRFRSRKLLLILAFLSIDLDSYMNTPFLLGDSTALDALGFFNLTVVDTLHANEASSEHKSVWIQDEESDRCFGPHGFSVCSDLTIWEWRHTTKGAILQSTAPVTSREQRLCLSRAPYSAKVELSKCSAKEKNVYWKYDQDTGALESISTLRAAWWRKVTPLCVVNDDIKRLQDCRRKYTVLTVITLVNRPFQFTYDDDNDDPISPPIAVLPSLSNIPDIGFWQCPITGQLLPRNLDTFFTSYSTSKTTPQSGRQVLMGAGLFTKVVFGMKFNVYSIGWYVDVAALQKLPTHILTPFMGLTSDQLAKTESFIQFLIQPGGFDRTLILKLAMTLKKEVVMQGLVEELKVTKQHAQILMNVSANYPVTECPEGTEIAFTWHTSNNQDWLEIVIDRQYIFPLHVPGLAADFFYQYFRIRDPVSDTAQKGIATLFPALFAASEPYIPSSVVARDNVPSTAPTMQTQNTKKRFSFTTFVSKFLGPDHREIRRMRRWKMHLNSLLLSNRRNIYEKSREEIMATLAIIFYCLLLILVSLPPALLEKGARVVVRVRQRSMSRIKDTIRKTLSRSSSLMSMAMARPKSMPMTMNMTRPTSTDLKLYFK
jgi:hypothetical protein